jgi:hypothetical protein
VTALRHCQLLCRRVDWWELVGQIEHPLMNSCLVHNSVTSFMQKLSILFFSDLDTAARVSNHDPDYMSRDSFVFDSYPHRTKRGDPESATLNAQEAYGDDTIYGHDFWL